MKCKIFTSKDGYLIQGIADVPVKLETAINEFLQQISITAFDELKIFQSQSGLEGNFVTVTIFYWYVQEIILYHVWIVHPQLEWVEIEMGSLVVSRTGM